jgi:hypothetical protein
MEGRFDARSVGTEEPVMRLRRTATLFAIVTSLMFAGIAGAGAAGAAAATATLSIPYTGCVNSYGTQFDYTMRVQGSTNYYSGGMRVEVRLWGDDEWYDDFLLGPVVQSYSFSGSYYIDLCVNRSTLNEDIGQDEIYAGVRVYDASTGALKEKVESNRIRDYF